MIAPASGPFATLSRRAEWENRITRRSRAGLRDDLDVTFMFDSICLLIWQVIYFPSRPGYTDPHVKRRVLDYLLFMNSKVKYVQPAA